jgi:O-antigen/teichoic acid export membrane protein
MIGKLRLLFWLGIVMLFLPFFGIPDTWKTIIAVLIGIGLIAVSVLLRQRYRAMRLIIRNLEHTAAEQTLHE